MMLAFNHLGRLGRLGNQMFQYASLSGIAVRRGYEFGIPPSKFEDEWRSHQLFEVFELPNLSKQNIKYLDVGNAPVVQERFFYFDEVLLNQCPNDVSLWGFFQSEKYFKHIENNIKEDFTFRNHILEPCKEMISQLYASPIALHIRRTDYITNSNHTILGLDYYQKALKEFDGEPVLVFSDDPEWCNQQELFSDDRFLIAEGNTNYVDLCLMTLCSGHIIANSSFSWWGAWLSKSAGKKVVHPSKWFGPNNANKSTKDLFPEEWRMINEN